MLRWLQLRLSSPLMKSRTQPRKGWTTKTKSAKPLGWLWTRTVPCSSSPHTGKRSPETTSFSSWLARYQNAAAAGAPAVNGTIGALLEDDGKLCINAVVDAALRVAPPEEFAAYAPLQGLPSFLDLAVSLALGDHRSRLKDLGVHAGATATPGALEHCSSLLRTLRNEAKPFFFETDTGGLMGVFTCRAGLNAATYPLLPSDEVDVRHLDLDGFVTSLDRLVQSQRSVMTLAQRPCPQPNRPFPDRREPLCVVERLHGRVRLETSTLVIPSCSMPLTTSMQTSRTVGLKQLPMRSMTAYLGLRIY